MATNSSNISSVLRKLVIERAGGRCEYCLIHQNFSPYTHEVDHCIPRKHGGQTTADNLALVCFQCNRHKGSDLASFDPTSSKIAPLFNPRTQIWANHFVLRSARLIGLTPTGRATVFLLMLNMPTRQIIRQALLSEGFYP